MLVKKFKNVSFSSTLSYFALLAYCHPTLPITDLSLIELVTDKAQITYTKK